RSHKKGDFIQLIKQHIISRSKNEYEIFNYLLNNKNNLQNIFLLAIFYQIEIGTEKNEIKSFELYKEAADKGHIVSIYNLGKCYEDGIGTDKSEIRAFEFYQKAVDEDHIVSTYKLGECYRN